MTTRLLLGEAKYKESTSQRLNRICHECIKTTRLLLGVAKCTEYTTQQTNSMKIACAMNALGPHAYSWALPSTRSPKTQQIDSVCRKCNKKTRLLFSVAKYKESTSQRLNRICHECIKTTRLLLGVAKCKEYTTQQVNSM